MENCLIRTKQGRAILVDAVEFDALSKSAWCVDESTGYARQTRLVNGKWHTVSMHRILMGLSVGAPGFVDHINGDKLDNRRVNLRLATPAQSVFNRRCTSTTGAKGVYKAKRFGYWGAKVMHNYRVRCLGTFPSFEEAVEFRQLAAEMLHGEFANHGVRSCSKN